MNPPPLPVHLMYARYDSDCPQCLGPIRTGDPISKPAPTESYICTECTRETLAFLTPSDPMSDVLEDIRNEARLRRLLDLEMEPAVIIVEDERLHWELAANASEDSAVAARVQPAGDLLFITWPLPLDPFEVRDD